MLICLHIVQGCFLLQYGAGTLGVPLGGTRRVGGLLGVAGRPTGTVHFKYSNVYLSIPNSLTVPFSHFPPLHCEVFLGWRRETLVSLDFCRGL